MTCVPHDTPQQECEPLFLHAGLHQSGQAGMPSAALLLSRTVPLHATVVQCPSAPTLQPAHLRHAHAQLGTNQLLVAARRHRAAAISVAVVLQTWQGMGELVCRQAQLTLWDVHVCACRSEPDTC